MKLFKLWDYKNKSWIEDDIDKYVEFNWTLPGYDGAGEAFVDIKDGVNVEIVWQNAYDIFVSPK